MWFGPRSGAEQTASGQTPLVEARSDVPLRYWGEQSAEFGALPSAPVGALPGAPRRFSSASAMAEMKRGPRSRFLFLPILGVRVAPIFTFASGGSSPSRAAGICMCTTEPLVVDNVFDAACG
jgi:hypothetical protein